MLAVLEKEAYTGRVGATRGGGGVELLRPVPNASLLALQDIVWEGDEGAQRVEVHDMTLTFDVVWAGTGAGRVTYDGPSLAAGEYAVKLGDQFVSFSVAEKSASAQVRGAVDEAKAAVDALRATGVEHRATLMSVAAGIYTHAGMPTEALYLVDAALSDAPNDADLLALRKAIESRSGVLRQK